MKRLKLCKNWSEYFKCNITVFSVETQQLERSRSGVDSCQIMVVSTNLPYPYRAANILKLLLNILQVCHYLFLFIVKETVNFNHLFHFKLSLKNFNNKHSYNYYLQSNNISLTHRHYKLGKCGFNTIYSRIIKI